MYMKFGGRFKKNCQKTCHDIKSDKRFRGHGGTIKG